ncbi:isoleucine--tRNA ligase [Candidatus Kaiserbacteria bacterium]|nr:isoleucine--tRNA ligase [Candidatus Kaiserbacteria bacterium]
MAEKPQKTENALREEETLKFWQDNKIFEKSVEKSAPKGDYIFYDGPPFATGLPHYGHIVASVIKDVVPRFWTMRGYRVPRVWGWDCHGLPIENIVEKELGFKHKKDIKTFGIAKFNEACRERVLTYAHEWEKIIPRIGRWADMKNAYRTMDKPFMESVWWVFKQLYDKGLVYEDYRSMHICPRCETTLSQQEVSEGYKDVKDIAVTVKFKLKNPEKIGLSGDVYMLAWTTTPWTLPGNVALAVNANETYRVFSWEGVQYIDIKKPAYSYPGLDIKEFSGKELVGLEYEPPFDYYVKDKNLKNHENGWKVYAADFVTTDTGTGIAHEAPAFGADDWELLKKVNLPFVQHVNYDGTFKPEVKDFGGMEVKPRSDDDSVRLGTDIAVLKYLQEKGLLFAKENITHSYPHCWRCDTPLLNYATSSWFVKVEEIKQTLLQTAQAINWSPAHIQDGRWGKWLEGARDWSISRQRFWASVMPVWVCEKCKKQRVFGSALELEEASGKKVEDLHKHIVDEITVPCPALVEGRACEGIMRRVPDVLDTWFDSGSMPYGERHYPFERKEEFDKVFPAQFIAEGLDQTRAWFYYLHVLAGAIFQKNAFQNVIVNGIVLAEDGKKMSKKLQNYPDPMDVVEKYGADALRFYLLSSPVMQAENLSFSEKGVDDVLKKNVQRLGNVLAFYQLYANDTVRDFKSAHILDQWILARLAALVAETTEGYESYQLDAATRPLSLFIDDLSVWYVRRSRDRMKEAPIPSAVEGLATLQYVLYTLSKVMAPAMPFLAEHIFQAVREGEDEESVHLAHWPEPLAHDSDAAMLLTRMFATRLIVSQALKEREDKKLPVRQPLQKISIGRTDLYSQDTPGIEQYLELIKDEVNVKEVDFTSEPGVRLDTVVTEELLQEGLVREVRRLLQEARKIAKLSPMDLAEHAIVCARADEVAILTRYLDELQKTTRVRRIELIEGETKGVQMI